MKVIQIMPWIDEAELEALAQVIRSTFITEHQATRTFEENFQKLTGAKHAIAVFNATVGLYTALKALDVGSGDEVIVPDLTFVATANACIMAGGIPVFCDVDRRSFNMDPEAMERKITPRTKVLMPVHLYGQCADMDRIMKIAQKHNLKVVEDAAEVVGAKWNGQAAGTFGDIGVYSFYANKIMTTAEGGLILTDNDELAQKCKILKNHGRVESGTFIHPYVGFNFKFTDLQAAVGNAQFKKLPQMMKDKEQVLAWYKKHLSGVEGVEFPWKAPQAENVIWFVNIVTPALPSKQLSEHLAEHDIETRSFFPPLHQQPCYDATLIAGEFPNADWLYEHGLSLPSSHNLTEEEVKYVCRHIRDFFEP